MNKFFLLLLFVSCSYFVKKIDSDMQNEPVPTVEVVDEKVDIEKCSKNNFVEFLGIHSPTIDRVTRFLQRYPEGTFNSLEISVIYSLYQMAALPVLSSPESRFQILFNQKEQYFYFDYYSPEPGAFPMLAGLEDLLKRFNSKYTLKRIFTLLEPDFREAMVVSPLFENFLALHKMEIGKQAELNNYYIRGDESLKSGEKLPVLNLRTLWSLYEKRLHKDFKLNTKLLENQKSRNLNTYCNYDLDLYESSVFLIHENEIKSNIFGLRFKDQFILISTGLSISNISQIPSTHLFQGTSQSSASAVCLIKNPHVEMGLVSSNSRDPGQHIFRLLDSLEEVDSMSEFKKVISHSRHLYLNNPARVIYEASRGSEQQLTDILKYNLPIYYAEELGQIWGAFQNKNEINLFYDNRSHGAVRCLIK